ncbi:MAG: glycyl-radical enzyme activating protein, partial [Armatimonadetes bacterium]|nr:glycyl-radical enzyme activating protein [Armatimonadota bacterium]
LRCLWCHSPESICPKPEIVWYQNRCVQCGRCVKACPEGLRTFERYAPEGIDRDACKRCGRCVEACPQNALEMKGGRTTAGEVADEARRLLPFFRRSGGGVTLTGGEPTLQADFSHAVLALCRAEGIHTAIETCGLAPWESLRRLAGVTDLFLYDLKHGKEEMHRRLTGVSISRIVENLERLAGSGAQVIVRVPVIPGCNDSPEVIRLIGHRAREAAVNRITLLPFNPSAGGKYSWLQRRYALDGVKRQTDAEMRFLEDLLRKEGLTVVPA